MRWHARLMLRCCSALRGIVLPDPDYTPRPVVDAALTDPELLGPGAAPSPADAAVLLRMLLRSFSGSVSLPVGPEVVTALPEDTAAFGLELGRAGEAMLVRAIGYAPDGEILELFDPRPDWRRPVDHQPGDGLLLRGTVFKSYSSRAQKEAVRGLFTAPPWGVLLATLPTGGGKSLIAQLFALGLLELGSGAGTVVVVVPTIALAIDQHRSAERLFRRSPLGGTVAYLAGAKQKPAERQEILGRLERGELSMLFLAPERLLGNEVRTAAELCARSGRLAALVVDEAHLVATWGAQFRPHLQRLAGWSRRLAESAPKSFPTVLLSATVTGDVLARLCHLFVPDGVPYLHIDGSHLRGEPDFVFKVFRTHPERLRELRILLNHLPRPAIVYTTAIADAEEIAEALADGPLGYRRIRVFTGDSQEGEREEIIDAWRADEIDLVARHRDYDEFKRLGRGLGPGRDMHVPSSRVPDRW
jgi:hypothetical protein